MNFDHEKSNRLDKARKPNYWDTSVDPDFRFVKDVFSEAADPGKYQNQPRFRTKPLSQNFASWSISAVLNGATLGRLRISAETRRDVLDFHGKFPIGYQLDIGAKEESAIAGVWQMNKTISLIHNYGVLGIGSHKYNLPKSNYKCLESGVYLAFGFCSSIINVDQSVSANRIDDAIYDKHESSDSLIGISIRILHGYFRIRSFVDQFLQAELTEKKLNRQTKKKG